jgi:holin-like protein
MIDRAKLLGMARGMAVLLVFLFAGDAVVSLLRLPLPGSVVGMVLLAVSLRRKWLPFEWVRPAAHLLIRHMSLLYIPPGVGVMAYFGLIRREWLPLVAAGVVGLVAVMLSVGLLQQRLERGG